MFFVAKFQPLISAAYSQLVSLLPKVFIAVHKSDYTSFVLFEKADMAMWR